MSEEKSPFRFPLTEVKENGEEAVKASASAESFVGALTEGELLGKVSLDGVIRRVDEEAVFEGSASGRWRFECTRCLTPVEGAWSEAFEASAPIDGGPFDLTDEVRQSIALAQPMKIFCRPDCKGLCPVCRANRNETDCGHAAPAPAPSPEGETRKPRLTRRPQKG